MNIETLLEIIRNAKNSAPNAETRELAESFEAFVELYSQRLTPEAKSLDFIKRLIDSHRRVDESMQKASAKYGMSPDQMREYFKNPNNFSSQEWNGMQAFQQELVTEEAPAPKAVSTSKKLRRSNRQTVRV